MFCGTLFVDSIGLIAPSNFGRDGVVSLALYKLHPLSGSRQR